MQKGTDMTRSTTLPQLTWGARTSPTAASRPPSCSVTASTCPTSQHSRCSTPSPVATRSPATTPHTSIWPSDSASGSCVDTPTWRANLDWGARLGYDAVGLAAVNRRAVEFVAELAGQRPTLPTVVNGVIGPRGDGYVVGGTMSSSEAAAYHGLQARSFAEAGAEMISAITMTYAAEAIGVARAASAVGLGP